MNARSLLFVSIGLFCSSSLVWSADWPQWRGPNRDNKVAGFKAPATWPKELKQQWKVSVGLGDASPALVGDKIYVFTRQGDEEVIACLDAASGKNLWQEKYAAEKVTGAAATVGGGHPGPRATPAVAEGKVCTLGVGGVVSCLDAKDGKVAWRKDSKAWPQFFTSSSPLIAEGKCIVYLGGKDKGEVVAYDLATGEEKWKLPGEGAPYGSPVLMIVEKTKQVVTLTEKSIVGVGLNDGKLLWKEPFATAYQDTTNTPVVDGQTVICFGQKAGTLALRIEKTADGFAAKELWKNRETPLPSQYNTPVLKDGVLYGLAGAGQGAAILFCMNAQTGQILWKDEATRRGECGAVLDAGGVLLALTSDNNLVAFQPNDKAYAELAKYKVAETPIWAYPIVAENKFYVKDKDSLTLWTIE